MTTPFHSLPRPRGVLVLLAVVAPYRAAAQTAPADLGIQATAAYALIWNRAANPPDPIHDQVSARFNGRVAIRVARDLYLGVNAGSWMYVPTSGPLNPEDPSFGEEDGAVASTVVASAYAQLYPARARPFFVRAGIGYGYTATYLPTGVLAVSAPLVEDHHTNVLLTAGAGIDIRLHRQFAVTFSADYSRLLGGAAGFDLVSAVQLGVGLTVR